MHIAALQGSQPDTDAAKFRAILPAGLPPAQIEARALTVFPRTSQSTSSEIGSSSVSETTSSRSSLIN